MPLLMVWASNHSIQKMKVRSNVANLHLLESLKKPNKLKKLSKKSKIAN